MDSIEIGICEVCGNPGEILRTEMCNGKKSSRSLCFKHVPPDTWEKVVQLPNWTPAEEIAFLRKHLNAIDQRVEDPAQRVEFKAKLESMIAEIEADRRRLGEAE